MSRLDNLSNDSWEALNFLGVGRITFFVAPGRKWQDSYFVFCCAGPGVTGGDGRGGGRGIGDPQAYKCKYWGGQYIKWDIFALIIHSLFQFFKSTEQ